MKYNVWLEGYNVGHEKGEARYFGAHEGTDFRNALENMTKSWDKEMIQYFNINQLTYWGCRFFDNEKDARKQFG